jgi:putative membrane protein
VVSLRTARDAPGREPDYRFSLANERTFLAYVRTALALDVAGLAMVQFLTSLASTELRRAGGALLALAGLVTTVYGLRRWRGNQRAMRAGVPLPASSLPLLLATTIALVSLIAVLLAVAG